jgi:succinate dehydrogenase/fumarate reductase-like Fe-S protein
MSFQLTLREYADIVQALVKVHDKSAIRFRAACRHGILPCCCLS